MKFTARIKRRHLRKLARFLDCQPAEVFAVALQTGLNELDRQRKAPAIGFVPEAKGRTQ